jgi:CDP-paratose 2-epimerase
MKVLITGGAGFVGSRLAFLFKEASPENHVVALDNLKRRGSELNLIAFKAAGIEFVHGDIRNPTDMGELEDFDLLLECSAEPSVLAGVNASPHYLLQTNLVGTLNCLEWARERRCPIVFLSTSRVYSIVPLKELALDESERRFVLSATQSTCGVSGLGIDESFPTHLPRSLYGATKLASEMLIQEYVHAYGIQAVINRCGVIAGAGQLGKVDQGVFTLWMARHFYNGELKYTGFGGTGKQVRDLLHPRDLFELIRLQVANLKECTGEVFNVGGGNENSLSLLELTGICQRILKTRISIGSDPKTNSVDIPYYVTNNRKVSERFGWNPRLGLNDIFEDINTWLCRNRESLRIIFE